MLVLAALLLVTIDFRSDDDGLLGRVRAGVTTILAPIQEGLVTVVRPIGDAAGSVTDLFTASSRNAELEERVDELEARERSMIDLERENAELRDLLDLRERTELDTITARTIALGSSSFEWTMTIDVGRDDGVERDMPVIEADGLVGRVVAVTDSAAQVLLAIDPNFAAAARLATSAETGIVDGRGGDPMLWSPLDSEVELEGGDQLVTSSYDDGGGVYPAGIPIGEVAAAGTSADQLRREVEIRPFVDFTDLDHVMVVRDAPSQPLPTLEGAPQADFEPPDGPATIDPEDGDGGGDRGDDDGDGDGDDGDGDGDDGDGDGDGDDGDGA